MRAVFRIAARHHWAGRFQAAGLPTVVCGPGDIAQAHQPDEFITLDALGQGEHFLRKLIEVGAS